MQNLLNAAQMRDADSKSELSSIELMESAAMAFVHEFEKEVVDKKIPISIYCGTGNNGGDGLAAARLLYHHGYGNLIVRIARFSQNSTRDFDVNLDRIRDMDIKIIDPIDSGTTLTDDARVIIDALLGSGLNKPVEGELLNLIQQINASSKKVISIDVPSGFPSSDPIDSEAVSVKADLTISFQRPKINFFFPESKDYVGYFRTVSIGLDEEYIESLPSNWKLTEEKDITGILKPRQRFSHKGTYGHALIIAGSTETMGAALLCADACLHNGAGLTTACIPESGLSALNTRSPEVMVMSRNKNIPDSMFSNFTAIAVGPGTGTDAETAALLKQVLECCTAPLVLDADALNIMSVDRHLLRLLKPGCILTPHLKEFDRLFGQHSSWRERIDTARIQCAAFKCIILLKNEYSLIIVPDGTVYINPTGNAGMAVGGMGDVLTGMICSLLAQGYTPKDAALGACFIHGKAGDDLKKEGMMVIPPRYIIKKLPFLLSELTESGKEGIS